MRFHLTREWEKMWVKEKYMQYVDHKLMRAIKISNVQ